MQLSHRLKATLTPAQFAIWQRAALDAQREGFTDHGAREHAFAVLYTVFPALTLPAYIGGAR